MTIVVGDEDALRQQWAVLLSAECSRQGLTPTALQALLAADPIHCRVTLSAIRFWLAGTWTPKPTHQAAVCAVLKVPHTSIFPVSTFVEGRASA